MTEDTPWSRLWAAIDSARKELWDAEAAAQEAFFKALRIAIEEYGHELDPESFDEYGLPRETQGG